jgi:hypothetical protein
MMSLRGEYGIAHKNIFNSFKEGLDPSVVKGLQKRFDSFRKSTVEGRFNDKKGPAVDSDLSKMTPEQLKEYISTHGG